MSRTRRAALKQATLRTKIPWLIFLFLAVVVFFVADHDWYFSLSASERFMSTVDELSKIADQGHLSRRVVFFALGIFAVASLFRSRAYRINVNGSLGWLILLFLSWTFCSVAWSEDPALTVRKLVALAMICLGAFAVSQRFSPRDTILWLFFSAFIFLHLGIVAEIVLGTFHPLSGGYRFAGTLHPNMQGINCALLFLGSIFMVISEKRWRYLFCVAAGEALVFLFLTKSRTCLVFPILALLLYWFLALPVRRKGAVLLGAVFVSCLLVLLGEYILPTLGQTIPLGREDADTITLTGRIPLWEQALSYVAMQPIQGYGYDSFWTPSHIAEFSREQNWAVPNAHSVYIDCTLGLGIVGFSIFTLIIVSGIRRTLIAQKLSQNVAYGCLGVVLIFAALDGLLESTIIQPSHLTFVSMLALTRLGFSSRSAR